jgi:hypothetical protein
MQALPLSIRPHHINLHRCADRAQRVARSRRVSSAVQYVRATTVGDLINIKSRKNSGECSKKNRCLRGEMNNTEETEERFLWNQESTCDLIDLYKKYPVLYAPKDGNYKNKPKRLEALKAIRSEMSRRGRKMTVEDIKRKIHVLRTQYANQLSKIRKSQLSGTKPENIYKPTLWCFAQLDFLRNSDSALSVDVNSFETCL